MNSRIKYKNGVVVQMDVKSAVHLDSMIQRGAEKYEDLTTHAWRPIGELKFMADDVVPKTPEAKVIEFVRSQSSEPAPETKAAVDHAEAARPIPLPVVPAHPMAMAMAETEPEAETLFTAPADPLAVEVHAALHPQTVHKVNVDIDPSDSPEEIIRKVREAEIAADAVAKPGTIPVVVPGKA